MKIKHVQGLTTVGPVYWKIAMGINQQRSKSQPGQNPSFADETFRFDLNSRNQAEPLSFELFEQVNARDEYRHFIAMVDTKELRMSSSSLQNYPLSNQLPNAAATHAYVAFDLNENDITQIQNSINIKTIQIGDLISYYQKSNEFIE